jgi:acylglycerol lipase
MYGLQDKIIPPRAVCRWLLHQATIAPNTASQFYIYPQGWHMLTRQIQAASVLDDIQQWLKAGQAARPSTPSLDLPEAIEAVCL